MYRPRLRLDHLDKGVIIVLMVAVIAAAVVGTGLGIILGGA